MALWENLSKKASETTAKAIQQAKIISETAKLNSRIADEESKINANYFQIGKLYASIHAADPEDCFVGMLTAIAESEKRVSDLKAQIQQIKGIVRCEKCGAEVAKGVAFCSSCGTPMPKAEDPAADTHVKCVSCGAMVERGMRFCTACGKPMAKPELPVESEQPAVPEQTEQPTAPQKRVCPSCGEAMAEDLSFCTECGTKL